MSLSGVFAASPRWIGAVRSVAAHVVGMGKTAAGTDHFEGLSKDEVDVITASAAANVESAPQPSPAAVETLRAALRDHGKGNSQVA